MSTSDMLWTVKALNPLIGNISSDVNKKNGES